MLKTGLFDVLQAMMERPALDRVVSQNLHLYPPTGDFLHRTLHPAIAIRKGKLLNIPASCPKPSDSATRSEMFERCCLSLCTGIAALGRGGAAMPARHAGGMGPKEALMQLASEAVRVAAQSPFLENAVGRARAVLCCLYLPSIMQPGAGGAPLS